MKNMRHSIIYALFYKHRLFFQLFFFFFFFRRSFFNFYRCLIFSWIELQMMLRCCLIHITIIMLRHILYVIYLYPCLGLGLFMSYLNGLFFIFSLIFIVINSITSLKQTHLFFVHFLEYFLLFLNDNVDEESK